MVVDETHRAGDGSGAMTLQLHDDERHITVA